MAAPELWQEALSKVAQATESVGSFLYPRNQVASMLQLPVSDNMREYIDAYVEGGWFNSDPRVPPGWRTAESGQVIMRDHHLMTPQEYNSSFFFHEFERAWGALDWLAVSFNAAGNLWCLVLRSSAAQGVLPESFDPLLMAFARHLSRVVDLASVLNGQQNAEQIAFFEQMGMAAALLDWRGKLVALSTKAESLLKDGLRVKNGDIHVRDTATDLSLRDAILAAASGKRNRDDVVVVHREGRRPLLIQVTGLPPTLSDAFGRGRVLLRFFDTDVSATVSPEILRRTFGLTGAEARLAARLADERSLASVADELGISIETARTQLRTIFRKTDTHKQSDLISLMAALPAG